jgi:mRNA interferase MazF
MGKTRPCVVLSPDEMNRTVRTVIVAPMTSTRKRFPFRVDCIFNAVEGQIALDQMRAFDRVRFIRKLGRLDARTIAAVRQTLADLFS